MDTEPITQHFDRKACCRGPLQTDTGLLGMTTRLVDELEQAGLAGRSVLEVGCGRGGLLVALARRGAAPATGIDLSPESVAAATRLADAGGVLESCTIQVGNGARDDLAVHDMVVLDRVICCFPDASHLLANTIPAARHTYAFIVPRSRGVAGWVARIALWAEDTIRRLRRDPFRTFVHDVRHMDQLLADAGFTLRRQVARGLWELRIHDREPRRTDRPE